MKRILLLIMPIILIMLAFRPVKSHTVSGTVTDEKGNPLSSVSVKYKGSSSGTFTDASGKYSFTISSSSGTLIFSTLGYQTVEMKVNGKAVIDIVLSSSKKELQEVIVTAQGQAAQKRTLGYSTKSYNGRGLVGSAPSVNTEQGYYDFKRTDDEFVDFNREGYDKITENQFMKVNDNPLSTFSIDVDAASYSNVRRFLNQGQLPPAGSVRIEEMVNYFKYEYPQPTNNDPFSINTEIADAPWNKDHKLILIGLQGKKIPTENLPASNLVFLIDVSGSMQSANKLPLVKASMKMLVDQLREQDKISMVVYAGAAGIVLPPTSGAEKTKIKDAIDKLEAGGSTAGGAGIKLAYKTAQENFVRNGNNRVILCSDGDFNVGESSDDAMERLIETERKSGVFLTILGYGMGNYQDAKMQKLADKGNGNHAYIDGISEAKKVLVNEFGGTLFTIAKDVKLQIEFNPAKVQGYRLIGYENRMLAKEDFNDDKKDAGELGSGHTVTAIYEVIPVGVKSSFLKDVDALKYQKDVAPLSKSKQTDEILTVKFRYKAPDGEVSKLIEHPVADKQVAIAKTSDNFRFAAAVAQFGMLLRDSEFKSAASYTSVVEMARKARGNDDEGYRSEFIRLVESAQLLAKSKPEPKKSIDTDDDEETLPISKNK
ncbi:MAG TPA: von Willebrand factor type A domain-containing protein [Chitinophagaceae bacterium]|nr:von Willebrand factor type A domain-containing protein [Chitinophagaceae bacterium]